MIPQRTARCRAGDRIDQNLSFGMHKSLLDLLAKNRSRPLDSLDKRKISSISGTHHDLLGKPLDAED
jgi:hypothetical protein